MKRKLPSNWRQRIEIVVDETIKKKIYAHIGYSTIVLTARFIKGKTPKGFHSKLGSAIFETIHSNGKNYLVELDIIEPFQRRGLATMLFVKAIKNYLPNESMIIYWDSCSRKGKMFYKWFAENKAKKYKTDLFTSTLTIIGLRE